MRAVVDDAHRPAHAVTDRIVTYPVADDGSLGAIVIDDSEGRTPFGFDFTSGGVRW